jgi:hypothetical protein
MATHTEAEMRWAARQLAAAALEVGLEPAGSAPASFEEESIDVPTLKQAA